MVTSIMMNLPITYENATKTKDTNVCWNVCCGLHLYIFTKSFITQKFYMSYQFNIDKFMFCLFVHLFTFSTLPICMKGHWVESEVQSKVDNVTYIGIIQFICLGWKVDANL